MKNIFITTMLFVFVMGSQSWGTSAASNTSMFKDTAACAEGLRTKILPSVAAGTPVTVSNITEEEKTGFGENQLAIFGQRNISPHVTIGDTSDAACLVRMAADSLFGGAAAEGELTQRSIASALLKVTDFTAVKGVMLENGDDEAARKAYGKFMVSNGLWPQAWAEE
ncbi:hypothetical protein OAN22_01065 [Alphaproteobacteria bacterium]|nr:hypothetical protein [Alphaproteobacteria bacterium]